MARSKKGFDFIPLVVLAGVGALFYLSGKSGDKEAVKKSSTQPTGTTPPPGPRPQTVKPPPKISGSVPAQEAQVESTSYSDLQSLGYSISSPVEAIRKFQEDYNTYKSAIVLSVDGDWGPKTSAALEDVFASFPDQQSWMQALTPATSAEYDFDRDYALAELGYMESDAAENMYRFQIDYLNHTQQPQTEGLAIYSWSLEWENALRWTYETLRDLWSGLVVQGVTWAEVADQVAAEQESNFDGITSVTIWADPDDRGHTNHTWGSTHVHRGFTSPAIYDADPEFVENKNPYYFKNGLTPTDIIDLMNRVDRGEIGEFDPIDSLPENGGYVGVLWTGPLKYTELGDFEWEPHLHYVPITLEDIKTLMSNKSVKIGSSLGFETEDRAREYHYHEVKIKAS